MKYSNNILTINSDYNLMNIVNVLSNIHKVTGNKTFKYEDVKNILSLERLNELLNLSFFNKQNIYEYSFSEIGKFFSQVTEINNDIQKIYLELLNDNVKTNNIRVFAFLNTYFKELNGYISELEFIPIFLTIDALKFKEILSLIRYSRKENNPQIIESFITEKLKYFLTEEDFNNIINEELQKLTKLLKNLNFIFRTNSSYKEKEILFLDKYSVSLSYQWELTTMGYEFIYGDKYAQSLPQHVVELEIVDEEHLEINKRHPEIDKSSSVLRFKRDQRVVKRARQKSDDLCFFEDIEIGYGHPKPPIGKKEELCLEVHHIVPMCFQKEFEINLDQTPLTICICMACHKILHHGCDKDREKLVKYLYHRKKDTLKELLNISSYNEFKKYYEF